ncbi:MAG: hypothetical protein R2860_09275 [Desulfobacterales bacterium]
MTPAFWLRARRFFIIIRELFRHEHIFKYTPAEALSTPEIHVQLNAATKLFCDCPNQPGDAPNRNTCPVCLWLPGPFRN